MSSPTPRRARRRFAPAAALIGIAVALVALAPRASREALLGLLAAPIITQLLISILAPRRQLIHAAAVPTVSLGVLAIGPTMLPAGFPLWLLGAVIAAAPRSSSPLVHGSIHLLIAIAAAIGLARAGAEPMTLAAAVLVILSVAMLSAGTARADTADPDGARSETLELQGKLEAELSTTRELRRERAQLERSVEDRLITLQATNRTLERETHDLRNAKEQALEASRIKSSFLANISHELRTPLNAIIGYSEMLLEAADERGSQAGVDDQRSVLNAAQSLYKIVNDVLDLTTIEAGKLEIHAEVFQVIELVEAIGNAALPLARRNGNTVKLKYSRELGYIKTDRTKLNRVLLDLVTNACKFTHGGRIELRVDAEVCDARRFFVFTVTDTGIGISEAMLGTLFEPFRMADESSTREYGGLGLGLALAKHYSEMLGGEISVTSALGEGSIFKVRLPVEPEDPLESGHILVSMY